ncbi:hypothetical protein BDW22DRAFT_974740 [Trametopsis cervina]|nr:hypothetical protein BDW22DRAFT_974740 [Trametopsis cervina]
MERSCACVGPVVVAVQSHNPTLGRSTYPVIVHTHTYCQRRKRSMQEFATPLLDMPFLSSLPRRPVSRLHFLRCCLPVRSVDIADSQGKWLRRPRTRLTIRRSRVCGPNDSFVANGHWCSEREAHKVVERYTSHAYTSQGSAKFAVYPHGPVPLTPSLSTYQAAQPTLGLAPRKSTYPPRQRSASIALKTRKKDKRWEARRRS